MDIIYELASELVPDHFHFGTFDIIAFVGFWITFAVSAWFTLRYQHTRVPIKRYGTGPEYVLSRTYLIMMYLLPHLYWFNIVVGGPSYYVVAPFKLVGMLMLAVSIAIYYSARKTLGILWHQDLVVYDTGEVVQKGPYAYVRHPLYASLLLHAASHFLLVPNWIVAGVPAIALVALLVVRIPLEEEMLKKQWPQMYKLYMKRVSDRVIPFLI